MLVTLNLTIETQGESPALTLHKQESEEIKTASLNLWELIYSVRSGSLRLACVDLHFLIVRDIQLKVYQTGHCRGLYLSNVVSNFCMFYLNVLLKI